MITIVSCSLSSTSKSRQAAKVIHDHYAREPESAAFIDLADYDLPLCDGDKAYKHPNVKKLINELHKAEAIIMALPIYNYSASAAAKNFIELANDAFENKIVGFICAAAGQKSYMSVLHLANSLLLDFRCLIVPKFVYVDPTNIDTPELTARLHDLYTTILRLKAVWK